MKDTLGSLGLSLPLIGLKWFKVVLEILFLLAKFYILGESNVEVGLETSVSIVPYTQLVECSGDWGAIKSCEFGNDFAPSPLCSLHPDLD